MTHRLPDVSVAYNRPLSDVRALRAADENRGQPVLAAGPRDKPDILAADSTSMPDPPATPANRRRRWMGATIWTGASFGSDIQCHAFIVTTERPY